VKSAGSLCILSSRIVQNHSYFFLFAILASPGCGARSGLEESLGSSNTAGGLPAIGGSTAYGGSPSAGGSTNAGATTCPPGIPQAGDPCPSAGLYCKYDNTLCLIAYQCSASGEFEWAGNCPAVVGTGGRSTSNSTGGAQPTGGTTSNGGSAGSGCTGSLEMISADKGLCVAKMVSIAGPASDAGNLDYKIDATEVTKGQYDAWLSSKPALPASTDMRCGHVTSYAEQNTGYIGYTGADADHHPVVDVDWCDAYEYCIGVDKRLCGAIGGGTVEYSWGSADANQSQWYRACSSGGMNIYPYGNTYQGGACDGIDYGNVTKQTVAVGSLANCVTSITGYAGVYDLSGNVWEWEDSCTGQSTSCRIRGGCFWYVGSVGYTCGYGDGVDVRNVANDLGFRCCSR